MLDITVLNLKSIYLSTEFLIFEKSNFLIAALWNLCDWYWCYTAPSKKVSLQGLFVIQIAKLYSYMKQMGQRLWRPLAQEQGTSSNTKCLKLNKKASQHQEFIKTSTGIVAKVYRFTLDLYGWNEHIDVMKFKLI